MGDEADFRAFYDAHARRVIVFALGLRVTPDEFFSQIRQALLDRGCPLRPEAA